MHNAYKYIDLQYIEEMADGCPDFLREVVELFIHQVEEYIQILDSSIEANDFDSVKRIIHKSKSAMGVVGISKLSAMLNTYDNKKLSIADKDELMQFLKEFKNITYLAIDELKDVLDKNQIK